MDKALKAYLTKTGNTQRIKEIESSEKKSGVFGIIKETGKQFFSPGSESQKKVIIPVAKFLAPVGESVGHAIAVKTKDYKSAIESQAKLDEMNLKLARDINAGKYKGKDTTKLEKKLQENISSAKTKEEEIVPSLNKSNLKIAGEGLMTAVNAVTASSMAGKGLAATGPVSSAIVNANRAINAIGKGKNAPVLSKLAGSIIRGTKTAAGGALFGTAAALEEGKRSPEEIAKEAGLYGGISLLLPPILGKTIKAGSKVIGGIASQTNRAIERSIPVLRTISEKTPNTSGNWLIDTANSSRASIGKTIAAMGVRAGEVLTKPLNPAITDRLYQLGVFDKQAENILGKNIVNTPASSYVKARNFAGVPEGKFTVAKSDFDKIFSEDAKQIKEEALGYLKGLDLLDRAGKGQTLEGSKTALEIQKELADIEQRVIAKTGDTSLLQKIVKDYNAFTRNNILNEYVESGLISKEASENILKEHPNWTPHDVLDFFEEQANNAFTKGGSFNVADNAMKAAKGSDRELASIDVATLHRTQQAQIVAEKNRVMRSVFEKAEQDPEAFGFKQLRSAENVTQRMELIEESNILKRELSTLLKEQKISNKYDRKTTSKINALRKQLQEIDDDITKQMNTFFAGQPDEVTKLIDKEVISDKVPLKLEQFAEKIRKENLTLEQFANDPSVIREYEGGLFEREGYGTLNKFYNTVQSPTKIIPEKTATKIIKPTLPGTAQLQERTRLANEIERKEDVVKSSIDDSLNMLESKINEISERRKGIFDSIRNELADTKIKEVDYKNQGYEKVSYYKNGVREDWLVPSDLGAALKNLDAQQAGFIARWLKIPADILRAGATRLNIGFTVSNFPRDLQTAAGISENGLTPRQVIDAMNDVSNMDNPQTRAFFQGGGAFGGLIGAEKPSRNILEASKRAPIFNVGTKVGESIESVGERFENATRFAVYKNAIANGMPEEMAIFEARNATVDFAKMGNVTGVINQVVPFLNARVQGMVNTMTKLNNDPTKFIRRQLFQSVYPTLLLYAHNNNYESFKNIPQTERDNYWIIQYGEEDGYDDEGNKIKVPEYIKIRKGEIQQAIANSIEQYMDMSNRENPRAVQDFLKSQIANVSPISISSFGPLSTPIELTANYDLFRQTPIEPEYQSVVEGGKKFPREQVPSELRKNSWTGATAQHLSEIGLNKIGLSPARIEFVVGKIFGTAGKDLLKAVDMTQTGWDQSGIMDNKALTEQQLSYLPIFKTFIGSSASGEKIMYYDLAEKINKERFDEIDMPKELQAMSYYEMAMEIKNKQGVDKANEFLQGLKLDKDMKSRYNRIKENHKKGQSNFVQVFNNMGSNGAKVEFLIEVINQIPSKTQKNKLLSDVNSELSADLKTRIRNAIKQGLIIKSTEP